MDSSGIFPTAGLYTMLNLTLANVPHTKKSTDELKKINKN
jgi:hypothetical protein